jgi:hypothetical protein
LIPTDIIISGSPNDVWIFQVAGNLAMNSAVRITLASSAQAKTFFGKLLVQLHWDLQVILREIY